MHFSYLLSSLSLWSVASSIPVSTTFTDKTTPIRETLPFYRRVMTELGGMASAKPDSYYEAENKAWAAWLKDLNEATPWIPELKEMTHWYMRPKLRDPKLKAADIQEQWYLKDDNHKDMKTPFSQIEKIECYYYKQDLDTSIVMMRLVFYGSDNKLLKYPLLDAKAMWEFRKHMYTETGSGIVFEDLYKEAAMHSADEWKSQQKWSWNEKTFEQSIRKFESLSSLKNIKFKPSKNKDFSDFFFQIKDITSIECQVYEFTGTSSSKKGYMPHTSAKIAIYLYGPESTPLNWINLSNLRTLDKVLQSWQWDRRFESKEDKSGWKSGAFVKGEFEIWDIKLLPENVGNGYWEHVKLPSGEEVIKRVFETLQKDLKERVTFKPVSRGP